MTAPPIDPRRLLAALRDRLGAGLSPAEVVEEFQPVTKAQALAYARRMPLWDEYRGEFSGQAVALARVLSRRAMRRYGLTLTAEGRVVEDPLRRPGRARAAPRRCFPLRVGDDEPRVEYAPHYFPNSDMDLLTFVSPYEPPRPHALSASGTWAHFASRDAVEACGGPEGYAALLAEAVLQGDRHFDAAFGGPEPEPAPRRRQPAAAPVGEQPTAEAPQVSGPHSARVLAEEAASPAPRPAGGKPRQGFLF
jgi:hypothetical protein